VNDETPKVSLGKLEWGVIVALLMSALSTTFSAGVVYNDVRDHERRITSIEDDNKDVATKLAGIEANVQFLVNRARDEDNRRP
jgi:hypothetical protein